ncbi:DNA-binding response regulator [Collimonas arenae]|uniref:DNA-binding response regulator n=1 Tax=Collimonas arenae TaxID=279058 RepID=A0A0A1FJ41_9BURK|nr:DNA-binding response regulator [Collimonas arenae]
MDSRNYDMALLATDDVVNLTMLQWIRDNLPANFPVVVIGNRSGEDDVVRALNAGADNYIAKPVRTRELAAVIQALMRRTYSVQPQHDLLRFDSYAFHTRSYSLTMADRPIKMTDKEFELALLLFSNLNQVISRTYILTYVWGHTVPTRSLDVHLARIRRKLQLGSKSSYRLISIYAQGYKLSGPFGD